MKAIEALGGDYEGVIASVDQEDLRNNYRARKSTEPVISFLDGKRLVLNTGMLRQCIEWFGPGSEVWIGRRVRVFLRRVEVVNKQTGVITVLKHRGILCEDAHARAFVPSDREPGEDDELSTTKDCDALEEAPVRKVAV